MWGVPVGTSHPSAGLFREEYGHSGNFPRRRYALCLSQPIFNRRIAIAGGVRTLTEPVLCADIGCFQPQLSLAPICDSFTQGADT